jgi:decaprenyl-phosphate phosphoribosyltransferase
MSFYLKILPNLLRINNWPKNLLVFTPLILSHNSNILLYADTFLLMFVMCLLSSSVYIFNDISDIEIDKNHNLKKNRPFASNKISKNHGYIIILILLVIAFTIQFYYFNKSVLALTLVYLFSNFIYTKILREARYFELLILTSFYLLRIYLGSLSNEIELSVWYIAFAFFIFLFLSVLKRAIELQNNNYFFNKKSYKGYIDNDSKKLIKLNDKIILITIFVLFAYYMFGIDKNLYSNYEVMIIPILLIFFWMLKVNNLVKNHKIKIEIINFMLKDLFSYILLFLVIIFTILSI